jgi:perosamine synthetase
MKVDQFSPFIGEEEIQSVVETMRSNWLTEGPRTAELESMLCEICGVKHVHLMPNGTLALFVANMAAGIGPGDEVIVPDFTFMGSATSVVLTGAKVVFADVNTDDFNLSVDSVRKNITERTKAIMPVHIYGQSANMAEIMKVAKENNLMVIEDAAQGIGAVCGNKHVGSIGDVGCFSFFADKTFTTGEGGAVVTNDDKLGEDVAYLKNQGRLQRGSFIHPRIGFNFRLTDLQAAIGVAQLKKLDFIIRKKHENEKMYAELLKGYPVEFPRDLKRGSRVPFRVNILVEDPERLGEYLGDCEVGTRRFFYPLHTQPCFDQKNSGFAIQPTNSTAVFERGLSLPSSVGLKSEEIEYVCQCIRQFYD